MLRVCVTLGPEASPIEIPVPHSRFVEQSDLALQSIVVDERESVDVSVVSALEVGVDEYIVRRFLALCTVDSSQLKNIRASIEYLREIAQARLELKHALGTLHALAPSLRRGDISSGDGSLGDRGSGLGNGLYSLLLHFVLEDLTGIWIDTDESTIQQETDEAMIRVQSVLRDFDRVMEYSKAACDADPDRSSHMSLFREAIRSVETRFLEVAKERLPRFAQAQVLLASYGLGHRTAFPFLALSDMFRVSSVQKIVLEYMSTFPELFNHESTEWNSSSISLGSKEKFIQYSSTLVPSRNAFDFLPRSLVEQISQSPRDSSSGHTINKLKSRRREPRTATKATIQKRDRILGGDSSSKSSTSPNGGNSFVNPMTESNSVPSYAHQSEAIWKKSIAKLRSRGVQSAQGKKNDVASSSLRAAVAGAVHARVQVQNSKRTNSQSAAAFRASGPPVDSKSVQLSKKSNTLTPSAVVHSRKMTIVSPPSLNLRVDGVVSRAMSSVRSLFHQSSKSIAVDDANKEREFESEPSPPPSSDSSTQSSPRALSHAVLNKEPPSAMNELFMELSVRFRSIMSSTDGRILVKQAERVGVPDGMLTALKDAVDILHHIPQASSIDDLSNILDKARLNSFLVHHPMIEEISDTVSRWRIKTLEREYDMLIGRLVSQASNEEEVSKLEEIVDNAQLEGIPRENTRQYRRWVALLRDLLFVSNELDLRKTIEAASLVESLQLCPLVEAGKQRLRQIGMIVGETPEERTLKECFSSIRLDTLNVLQDALSTVRRVRIVDHAFVKRVSDVVAVLRTLRTCEMPGQFRFLRNAATRELEGLPSIVAKQLDGRLEMITAFQDRPSLIPSLLVSAARRLMNVSDFATLKEEYHACRERILVAEEKGFCSAAQNRDIQAACMVVEALGSLLDCVDREDRDTLLTVLDDFRKKFPPLSKTFSICAFQRFATGYDILTSFSEVVKLDPESAEEVSLSSDVGHEASTATHLLGDVVSESSRPSSVMRSPSETFEDSASPENSHTPRSVEARSVDDENTVTLDEGTPCRWKQQLRRARSFLTNTTFSSHGSSYSSPSYALPAMYVAARAGPVQPDCPRITLSQDVYFEPSLDLGGESRSSLSTSSLKLSEPWKHLQRRSELIQRVRVL